MRRLLLSTLFVVAVAGLVALPAGGTTRGKNGPIVYSRLGTLWIVSPDGTGARKLPHVPRTEDDNPDWSPDGKRIAFERCSQTNCEVWTAQTDGAHAKRLGPNCLAKADDACGDRSTPSWSPDGKRVAFG